jgi:hypothetical protein
MNIEKGELLKLTNDKEYLVVDVVMDNNTKYIYLANEDEGLEVLLTKEVNEDGNFLLESVADEAELVRIMKIISSNNKE